MWWGRGVGGRVSQRAGFRWAVKYACGGNGAVSVRGAWRCARTRRRSDALSRSRLRAARTSVLRGSLGTHEPTPTHPPNRRPPAHPPSVAHVGRLRRVGRPVFVLVLAHLRVHLLRVRADVLVELVPRVGLLLRAHLHLRRVHVWRGEGLALSHRRLRLHVDVGRALSAPSVGLDGFGEGGGREGAGAGEHEGRRGRVARARANSS